MAFLDNGSGDAPDVVTRIPGLIAVRNTPFGNFLNAFSAFLLEPALVQTGLVAIEERMWVLAQSKRPGATVLTREILAGAMAQRSVDRGPLSVVADQLLSEVLTLIENEHGFEVVAPRRRAVTLSGLVLNDPFRNELIAEARTWKDPSVNPAHGEFTHRLQWCAAMLAMPALPVAVDWHACFVAIGAWADADLFDGSRFGLWDAIVDRNAFNVADPPTPYDSRNAQDFRSPENLQAWLLAPERRLAANRMVSLATFINARNTKRVDEETDGVPYISPDAPVDPDDLEPRRPGEFRQSTWDKWSRVLFQNRRADQLNWAEKATLARAWNRLTMLQDGEPRYPIMVVVAADQVPAAGPDLVDAYESLGLQANGQPW
jgi:Family of unknown function (DUF5636)